MEIKPTKESKQHKNISRRNMMSVFALLAMRLGTAHAQRNDAPPIPMRQPRTPSTMEGPFYPNPVPVEMNTSLVCPAIDGVATIGEPMLILGRLIDEQGHPVGGAEIQVWQLNGFGRYHHPNDQRDKPIDPAFMGFGRTLTSQSGEFNFTTIRPGWEETRILGLHINLPPHIHFKIKATGKPMLTTELHFPTDETPTERRFLDRFAPFKPELTPTLKVEAARLVARFDFVI